MVDLLLSDEKLTGPSTPGDIYWTLGDNLNTVRDIARYNPGNDTTTIVNHRVYDAFGKLTSETNGAVDLLFAFTGRLFDESTGLQNNLHRWYDPAIGRWLSEDPISFKGGDSNLYRYVNNAPTLATDATGLDGVVTGRVNGYGVRLTWSEGSWYCWWGGTGRWGQPDARSEGQVIQGSGTWPSLTTKVKIWDGNVCNTIHGSFADHSGEIKAEAFLPPGDYRITWQWVANGATTCSSSGGGTLNVDGTSTGDQQFQIFPNEPPVFESNVERTVVKSASGGSGGWVKIGGYRPILNHPRGVIGTTTARGTITIMRIEKVLIIPPPPMPTPPWVKRPASRGSGGSGGA